MRRLSGKPLRRQNNSEKKYKKREGSIPPLTHEIFDGTSTLNDPHKINRKHEELDMKLPRILFLGICCQLPICSTLNAQEQTLQDPQTGSSVKTRITTLDGKELDINAPDSPVKIIQVPGAPGQPNRVEFRIDSLVNRGEDQRARRTRRDEPTTMRQVRIGDYKTDGVLMMDDMWQTMASQLLSRFLGPVELKTLGKDQSLADFAKKNGLTERELRMLHPLMDFEDRDQELPVCVELTHRILPGETLSFLADLYQTDEATLKTLNSIEKDEDLTWRKIRVPVVMEVGRFGLSCYVVMYAPAGRKPSFNANDYVRRTHRVTKGDTLDSIAKAYRTSAADLRLINRLESDANVKDGQTLVVQSDLRLADSINPEWLVHAIDTELKVDLAQVLELNGLKNPEAFQGGSVIKVPSLVAQRSTNATP